MPMNTPESLRLPFTLHCLVTNLLALDFQPVNMQFNPTADFGDDRLKENGWMDE